MKRLYIFFCMLALAIGVAATKRYWSPMISRHTGNKSVADRLQEFGPAVQTRLIPVFEKAGLNYPPASLVFVGIKNKNVLEVYGANDKQPLRFVCSYPIRRASGGPGPKLREGDGQVPEGIYPIELLNPNSKYHLSLRIGYPNEFDRQQAQAEGRSNLGGDIMIHGGAVSVGCLAMGDEAAEHLFVLAAQTGIKNIEVILTPVDFRRNEVAVTENLPAFVPLLYANIRDRLATLPLPH